MLGDRSIKELTTAELKEEVSQWFHQIEQEVDLPKDYTQHFGKWDEFKTIIEEVLWEYDQVCEELDKQSEDAKKLIALQEAIAEVSNDLYTVGEIDISEPDEEGYVKVSAVYAESIDNEIADAAKLLEEMLEDNWEPYKKKAKNKRK